MHFSLLAYTFPLLFDCVPDGTEKKREKNHHHHHHYVEFSEEKRSIRRYPFPRLLSKVFLFFLPQKAFFQDYPAFEAKSFHGQPCRSRSASTCSSLESCKLPVEQKEKGSDIRGEEAVNRVADTIFQLKKDDEKPIFILQNKQYQHFQEKNDGLLCLPKEEEDLQRGDFDIIIIHRVYGYIHIEVKVSQFSQSVL